MHARSCKGGCTAYTSCALIEQIHFKKITPIWTCILNLISGVLGTQGMCITKCKPTVINSTFFYYRYNVHEAAWEVHGAMNTPRCFCLAASINSEMVVVGGGASATSNQKMEIASTT